MNRSTLLQRLWSDERGQDLVEYVVLALVIAAVVSAALLAFKGQVGQLFRDGANGISAHL